MGPSPMDRMLAERFWGIPWSVLALAALGVMAVYLVVDTSHGTTGATWVVLRWFHSLCWLLLALAALTAQAPRPAPFVTELDAIAQKQLKARAAVIDGIKDRTAAQARNAAVRERVLALILLLEERMPEVLEAQRAYDAR